MVKDFILFYVRKVVDYPEFVEVLTNTNEGVCNIKIRAKKQDVGRLIGKNGKMISAIKTVVSACKAKDGLSYKVVIEEI